MADTMPIRVLFLCTGNICRSPMAEAVFRQMVAEAGLHDRFEIASAGTGGWHVGERPHSGTQAVLQRNNVPLGQKRAQQLTQRDTEHYDYILAMDDENLSDMHIRYNTPRGELRRLLEFAPESNTLDVPDPYYTGGFDRVYRLVTAGCRGFLDYVRQKESL